LQLPLFPATAILKPDAVTALMAVTYEQANISNHRFLQLLRRVSSGARGAAHE
jgi:hypothetical protein